MSGVARGRTTVVLVAVGLLLAAGLVMEIRYLGADDPAPTMARPVVTGAANQGSAVRAAATATATALSYGYEAFDAQVGDATDGMTPEFAREYLRTTAEAEPEFAEERTTQEVRVVDSAVVAATDTAASVLLYLDRYLARAGAGTSVTQYRALVTVERRDRRWLLSAIETG